MANDFHGLTIHTSPWTELLLDQLESRAEANEVAFTCAVAADWFEERGDSPIVEALRKAAFFLTIRVISGLVEIVPFASALRLDGLSEIRTVWIPEPETLLKPGAVRVPMQRMILTDFFRRGDERAFYTTSETFICNGGNPRLSVRKLRFFTSRWTRRITQGRKALSEA